MSLRSNKTFGLLLKTFLVLFFCLFFLNSSRLQVNAQIAGGTYDGVDWQITDAGELVIGKEGQTQEYTYHTNGPSRTWPWSSYKANIKSVSFTGTVKGHSGMSSMFSGLTNVTKIDCNHFDTSNVTDMNNMFASCEKLTDLNISGLDTSNVTAMYSMFRNCKALTNLDLSRFDTSNVTDMSQMFQDCNALTSLDVSGFDTLKVTSMNSMFYNCKALTSLDLSGFDTSNVTDMRSMFDGCNSLTNLDVSGFDTSNVTKMTSMFQNCYALTSLDVSEFDTSNVTVTSSMFSGCKALTSLDVSGFDTSKVTSMVSMFAGCNALTNLDVTGFDTSNVTSMGSMFERCNALTSLDISGFDTSKVKDMRQMFYLCNALTSLDVSGFDTSKVTNMSSMFSGCSALTNLDVSGFDTLNVTNMSNMFSGCKALTSLDVSGFDTSKVTTMYGMFQNCNVLTSLDVSGFDTSNVTNMSNMFYGCNALTSLDLSGFDTSKVTDMSSMFSGCISVTSLDVSRFDTSKVTSMKEMFRDCSSVTSIDVSGFDTSNVTDMSYMFYGCNALTSLDVSHFNTSNVTTMYNMFYFCRALTSMDVSGFDTSKVKSMQNMFMNCSNITSLDISGFDMSKVTNKISMLSMTNNLKALSLGDRCNISGTSLPTVPTSSKKWRHTENIAGPYTSAELMSNYNPSMAGTWVWDVSETEGFVNYSAGLGTTTASAVTVTSTNPSVTVPAASTTKRPHYILAGWSKNPNATISDTLYTPGQTYNDIAVMGEATTLYAVWEPTNLRDYKVKHYKEKSTLDGYSLTTTETLQADYGTSVTPDRKTYTGFTTPPAQTGVVAEDDSLVIEYYYDYIRDIVKFDGNGATSGVMEDQTFIYNVSQKLSPATYSRKGHVFTGWNTKADGTGTSYTDQQSITFTPANTTETTLYAQWLDNSDNQMDVQNGVVYVTMKAGQTVVIPDLPAGTTYTIEEVNNPDWWEESAASNKTGLIEPNQTDESSITNTYKNEGGIQLVAHKKMNGRNLREGEFAFQLIQDGNVIDTQTNGPVDTDPYIYTEQGEMIENPWYGTAPVTFNAITLQNITTAGELHYTIKEVAGSDSRVSYDSHEEAVTVRYSSGAQGKINMTAVYDDNGALFENSINPGKLTFSKAVTEGSPADQTFNFTVNLRDHNGSPLTDTYPATVTGENNRTEHRTETITRYSHTPNVSDNGTNSGSYANNLATKDVISVPGASSLHVKVTYGTEDNWDMLYIFKGEYTGSVTRNMSAGQLYKLMGGNNSKRTAEYDIPGDTITLAFFSDTSNTYYGYYAVVTAEQSMEYETDKIETTVSDGSTLALKKGDVAEITGLPGGTSYTITEESKPGWTLVSSEGSEGSIPNGGNAQANFVNAYNAEGSAIITATKHLNGATLEEEMFTFELLDEDMNVIQAKSNDAAGNIIFDAIDYGMSDVGKTYTYFIREHAGEDTTYQYDSTVYTVNVAVTDNGAGILNAEVTYPDGTPVFENSVTKSISVSKQVTGSMGNRNDSFEFTLELTGAETGSITVTKNDSVMNITPVSGKYTFNMKHGDTVTFDGIGSGVGYKITETSANKRNYTTSVDNATTGTIQDEDVSVTFTNKREIAVNTGIDTGRNIGLLIMLCMTGFAGMLLLKKKHQYR